ncbi:AGAP004587-PA-like protein [Anopheles sinensis]|uniref:AGAP004587-PA-like protein n=1 Tax=Anopheles sinensis TaxID=74873 RepID=A0A084W7Q8_ANOSI|nr:AGAP004587-PA-like protein [Anopheles sinensis]
MSDSDCEIIKSMVRMHAFAYGIILLTVIFFFPPVMAMIRDEPEVMSYWLWLGAALGTGLGVLGGVIAAIASVLKAASASKKTGTMVVLFVSNLLTGISQTIALVCWLIQFYNYLTHNVLLAEDRNNNWYSTGLTMLGSSFYFIAGGIALVLINLILLIVAVRLERWEKQKFLNPTTDDKTQGAIMLY